MTTFQQLNVEWNAEPNAPDTRVTVDGQDVIVSYLMNPFRFPEFTVEDVGVLRFHSCSRYRFGGANDEAWSRGQCRFSKIAPKWGEFYEVSGDLRLSQCPADWVDLGAAPSGSRHFLFYFRDQTFECDAAGWSLEVWRPKTPQEPGGLDARSSGNLGDVVFRCGSASGHSGSRKA